MARILKRFYTDSWRLTKEFPPIVPSAMGELFGIVAQGAVDEFDSLVERLGADQRMCGPLRESLLRDVGQVTMC
jgi:hypothetical protein